MWLFVARCCAVWRAGVGDSTEGTEARRHREGRRLELPFWRVGSFRTFGGDGARWRGLAGFGARWHLRRVHPAGWVGRRGRVSGAAVVRMVPLPNGEVVRIGD